jgi:hypothetical protein
MSGYDNKHVLQRLEVWQNEHGVTPYSRGLFAALKALVVIQHFQLKQDAHFLIDAFKVYYHNRKDEAAPKFQNEKNLDLVFSSRVLVRHFLELIGENKLGSGEC